MKNKLTKKELISDFKKRNGIIFHDNEIILTNDYEVAMRIVSIEQLVINISKSKGDIFSIKENDLGKKIHICRNKDIYEKIKPYLKYSIKNKDLLININTYIDNKDTSIFVSDRILEIIVSFPIHKFNPYVNLFIKKLSKLLNKINHDESQIEAINEFVVDIRTDFTSHELKNELNKHRRLQNKNSLSIKEYNSGLFDKYDVLFVVKINFIYKPYENKKLPSTASEINGEYIQANKDRKHLFRNMRSNNIFEHIVGFIWKLEFCLQKGFHYQMIFYFDGLKEKADMSKAEIIGDYWSKTITNGRGLYFVEGDNKVTDKVFEIGMIRRDDIASREELRKAEDFLIKTDYYAKMIINNDRTLGKGVIKTIKDIDK